MSKKFILLFAPIFYCLVPSIGFSMDDDNEEHQKMNSTRYVDIEQDLHGKMESGTYLRRRIKEKKGQKLNSIDDEDNLDKKVKSEHYFLLGATCFKSYDFPRSLEYFKKSADLGNAASEYNIGVIYECVDSPKINKDLDMALKWYNRANDHGYTEAKKAIKRVSETKNGWIYWLSNGFHQ